jgi:hypothetical protein
MQTATQVYKHLHRIDDHNTSTFWYSAPSGDAGYQIEELIEYVDYIKNENGYDQVDLFFGEVNHEIADWIYPGEVLFYGYNEPIPEVMFE